jgi:hypothetical protein
VSCLFLMCVSEWRVELMGVCRISIATVISFTARGLSTTGIFCYQAVASAGVVLILPGYTICTFNIPNPANHSVWFPRARFEEYRFWLSKNGICHHLLSFPRKLFNPSPQTLKSSSVYLPGFRFTNRFRPILRD